MKIALILKSEKIEETYDDTIPIILLHTDNKVVTDVEKDIIVEKDINYLALWLVTERVKELYVMDIDPMVKQLFKKLGVIVRKYDEMDKNTVLKEFIS